MATGSNTWGNDGYVNAGAAGIRAIPTSTRRHDMSDLVVYQGRRWAPLDWILRSEMKKMPVTDMEPKTVTLDEAPQTFSCNVTSGTTAINNDTLYFTNTNARHMVVGDTLTCMDLFCDSDGANYSTTKFSSGYMPERMVIQSITLDGYAAGTATLVVRRGNGYNPASASAVTSDYKFIRGGTAMPTDWEAPASVNIEPGTIQNYLQVYSITASEEETRRNMEFYGKVSLNQLTEIRRGQLLRRIEYDHIWGRQSKVYVNNNIRYNTGGMAEYIPDAGQSKDGESRLIDFGGAFNVATFREKLEIIGRYGSGQKLVLTGGESFTILQNYFENYLTVNDQLTSQWVGPGVGKVFTWDAGHVQLNIMRHPGFTDFTTSSNNFSRDMLFIDLAYVKLMYLNNMDIRIRYGVQSSDVHHVKNEIYGVMGLDRVFPEAHAYMHGITGS